MLIETLTSFSMWLWHLGRPQLVAGEPDTVLQVQGFVMCWTLSGVSKLHFEAETVSSSFTYQLGMTPLSDTYLCLVLHSIHWFITTTWNCHFGAKQVYRYTWYTLYTSFNAYHSQWIRLVIVTEADESHGRISCHWRYCLPSDQAKHFGGGHLQQRTADLAWCLEKCEDGCAGHVLEHLPIISTLQSGFSAVYIYII